MERPDLERELELLKARVARLEQSLDLRSPSVPFEAAPPATQRSERRDAASTPGPAIVDQRAAKPVSIPVPASLPTTPPIVPPIQHAPTSIEPTGRPSPASMQPTRGTPLELIIGGRWMAWVGAIAVVIGAAFLAAVIDVASIWGGLPSIVKCLVLGAFGGVLVGGGEWVLRRSGRAASIGLSAAGLGTWYVTAFATFGWYGLLGETAAMLLLALVALIGVGLSLRSRSLVIAVLATIGGYLAPLLLRGASTFPAALPLYLTALLGIALALSAFAPRPFRPLRAVALGGQTILGAFWVADAGPSIWALMLVFGGTWWTMVLLECVYAALRRQSRLANCVAVVHATACFVSSVNILLWSAGVMTPQWSGAFTLGVALLAAAAALQFGPGLAVLDTKADGTPIDVLAFVLWVQAAILLPIAVALQFDGFAQTTSWLLIGVGAIEAGRRLASRRIDLFGLAVGALGVLKCLLFDWWAIRSLDRELLHVGSVSITSWFVLAIIAIAASVFASMRLRDDGGRIWTFLRTTAISAAALLWMAACVAHADALTATTGWLLAAGWCIAARRTTLVVPLFAFGRAILLLATLKWMTVDALLTRLAPQWSSSEMPAFLNGQMFVGLLIAAFILLVNRLQRADAAASEVSLARGVSGRAISSIARWMPSASVILVLWGAGFEVDRIIVRTGEGAWPIDQLRVLWLALLWGAGGAAAILLASARRDSHTVATGVFLLWLSALVWLMIGTLGFRLSHGPIADAVFLNPQCLIGLGLAVMLAVIAQADGRGKLTLSLADTGLWPASIPVRAAAISLLTTIGCWIGTFEIDRAFAGQPMARQTAWSIFWATCGIALIAAGFLRRTPIARYAGIALLGVTLVKVALIDTSQLEGVYRPLSYIVLGLLLVGTSIGYTRLSPRLLGRDGTTAEESRPVRDAESR